VVAHDCPARGARSAGAAPRLTAQADLDADGDVATVEVLACEVVEPRGLLGVKPGGRYLSRGLWASRDAADRGADPAHGTGPAADLLVALAHGDGTRSDPRVLPVVVRAAGDRPGAPSPAALGLQHATGPVQRYADERAAARLARAAGLLGAGRWAREAARGRGAAAPPCSTSTARSSTRPRRSSGTPMPGRRGTVSTARPSSRRRTGGATSRSSASWPPAPTSRARSRGCTASRATTPRTSS